MKMNLLAVTISALSTSDAAFVGRKAFLANGMQPEVVALTLSHVEDEWRAQAAVFADCGSTAALPGAAIVNCKDAPNSFGKSCSTVVSAIIQGSGGDRDVAKEYMADVCSQRAITGWHQQQCNALAITIKGAMGADRYQNRVGFNTAKLCTGFWSRFLTEERQRIAKENADHEAAEKKDAEEAATEAKEAEEAAHKKQADHQKAAEAAHKDSEAKAKAADAKANAAEVVVHAEKKKAQAVAVARVAKTEDKKANKDVAKVAVAVAKSAASAEDNKKAKVAAAAKAKVAEKDAKKPATKPSQAVATEKAAATKVNMVAKPAKDVLPATSKVAKAVPTKAAVAPAPTKAK